MGLSFSRNGDPALAAEPGFDDQTPGGSGGVEVPNGHALNIMPEQLEYFTENSLAGSSV